jgi:hypothetical protein
MSLAESIKRLRDAGLPVEAVVEKKPSQLGTCPSCGVSMPLRAGPDGVPTYAIHFCSEAAE